MDRNEREKALGAKIIALPSRRFGIIVGDPEWKFTTWSPKGMSRAAANHYPTSTTRIIAERPVWRIAAKDCILFLWATVPMLPDAMVVMAAWGFTYKSHMVWLKDKAGTGFWSRNKHELLLIGTKGSPVAPAMGTQWPSVIEAPRGRHSEKPIIFLDMIDALWPSTPKIELNRRGPRRKGWSAWGNEVE